MLCKDTVTTPLDSSGLTDPVLACETWATQSLKCVCNQLPWWSGQLFGGQGKGERHNLSVCVQR